MKRLALLLAILLLPGCAKRQIYTPTPAPDMEPPGIILYVADNHLQVRKGATHRSLNEMGRIDNAADAALTADGKAVRAVVREEGAAYLRTYTLADQQVDSIRLAELPGSLLRWAPSASYAAYEHGGTLSVLDHAGQAERLDLQGGQLVNLAWGPADSLLIQTRTSETVPEQLLHWHPGKGFQSLARDSSARSDIGSTSPSGLSVAYATRLPSGQPGLVMLSEVTSKAPVRSDLVVSLPDGESFLRSPVWSQDGGLLAAMIVTRKSDGAMAWSLLTVSDQGERVSTWAAPAYPCYIYGFWWMTGERLLVQIAGPGCGKMVELDGRSGTLRQEFDAPLKGLIHLDPTREWIAVEHQEGPNRTTLIRVERPTERITLPINGLSDWCCVGWDS